MAVLPDKRAVEGAKAGDFENNIIGRPEILFGLEPRARHRHIPHNAWHRLLVAHQAGTPQEGQLAIPHDRFAFISPFFCPGFPGVI